MVIKLKCQENYYFEYETSLSKTNHTSVQTLEISKLESVEVYNQVNDHEFINSVIFFNNQLFLFNLPTQGILLGYNSNTSV